MMRHVLQQCGSDGVPMYHHLNIDLRTVDVTSENGFLKTFIRRAMLSNLKEYFKGLKISAGEAQMYT